MNKNIQPEKHDLNIEIRISHGDKKIGRVYTIANEDLTWENVVAASKRMAVAIRLGIHKSGMVCNPLDS